MADALRLFLFGTAEGICIAGAIFMTVWLKRSTGIKDHWLVGGILALLGIGILAGMLYFRSLRPEAEDRVRKLDIVFMGMRVKTPCSGVTDTGFVIDYRKPHDDVDREGRICREITGGPWIWHPDTNDMSEAHVLP